MATLSSNEQVVNDIVTSANATVFIKTENLHESVERLLNKTMSISKFITNDYEIPVKEPNDVRDMQGSLTDILSKMEIIEIYIDHIIDELGNG